MSSLLSRRAAGKARHSRLASSMIDTMRNLRPSWVGLSTKSYAFLGRDDPIPRTEPKATAFEDERYKRMIKALHAERISRRLSRKRLSEQLGKPESYVAEYGEGRIILSVADFANVAEALGRHPAAMLRD